MTDEIRTEKTWWGGERQVAYEDGQRVGEVKQEASFLHQISGGSLGSVKEVAYDNDGRRVSETTHEPSFLHNLTGGVLGTDKSVTRDTDGRVISETRHGQGLLSNKNYIYEEDQRIGEVRREKGFWGGSKRVYRESGGNDLDILRRTSRRSPQQERASQEVEQRATHSEPGERFIKAKTKIRCERTNIYNGDRLVFSLNNWYEGDEFLYSTCESEYYEEDEILDALERGIILL